MIWICFSLKILRYNIPIVLKIISYPYLFLLKNVFSIVNGLLIIRCKITHCIFRMGSTVKMVWIFKLFALHSTISMIDVLGHSEQWQDISMCCSLYLNLDQQVVFSVARITGFANLPPPGCGLTKKASASTYLDSRIAIWAWVQEAQSWCSTTELPLSFPHTLRNSLIRKCYSKFLPLPQISLT